MESGVLAWDLELGLGSDEPGVVVGAEVAEGLAEVGAKLEVGVEDIIGVKGGFDGCSEGGEVGGGDGRLGGGGGRLGGFGVGVGRTSGG